MESTRYITHAKALQQLLYCIYHYIVPPIVCLTMMGIFSDHSIYYEAISGQFFFCLVCRFPRYTLSRKKKILIRGETGSTWRRNFYTGTQNE